MPREIKMAYHSRLVHVLSGDKAQSHIEKTHAQDLMGIASKIDVDNNCTKWIFLDECPDWTSYSTSVERLSLHLTGISSLTKEGFYSPEFHKWKRHYVSRDGVVLTLLEDVPEEGGQNCLWAAGLVMSR